MKKSFIRALSAITLAVVAQTSFAAVITTGSQISTGGVLNVIGGDGSVANALGVDFVAFSGNPAVQGTDGEVTGYTGTGDLAAFACTPGAFCAGISDIASFSQFSADSMFLYALASSTSPGFTFSLNAPLTVTRVPGTATAAAALILSGSGSLSADGYDTTNALFTLVTLNNTSGATTYSATLFALGTPPGDSTNPVPEPGSILLMGLGVAGLLAARRKTQA